LCPGNPRSNGQRNPSYTGTFAFDNDFPALLPGFQADPPAQPKPLLVAEAELGVSRVVCYSPRHDLTLGRMHPREIRAVVDAWCEESARLSALPFINAVTIFENRGSGMGASNPHPHCQIWANQSIPNELAKEQESQQQYLRDHGRCLLCDYLAVEHSSDRLIFENSSFAVLVPFWAVWPFETIVIGAEVPGGLRNASHASARHHRRSRGGAAALG
jgi:UDPglucose--hexose-1-phosphate uridylyltransferase